MPTRIRSIPTHSYLYPYITSMLDEAKAQFEATLQRRHNAGSVRLPTAIDEWAEAQYYIPSTSEPIKLLDHQRGILRLGFTRLPDGFFPYRTFLYSTVKQSGKTTISGLILRWFTETQGRFSESYAIGNDLDQAMGRGYREAYNSIALTPGYNKAREVLPGEWDCLAKTLTCQRTGSFIRALAVDATGEAGGKPAIQVWCVDEETECLTRAGWKLVVDLTTSDEVATLDPSTDALIWERPRAVNVTPYSGPMIRFESRRADFLVTPNHRVYGRFQTHSRYRQRAETRGWWFEEARDARNFNSGWLKGDANWIGESDYDERLAKVVGYFVSEGSCAKGRVTLSQSLAAHPETYEAIRQAVVDLGYRPSCNSVGVAFQPSPSLYSYLVALGKSHEKYIPQDLKDAPASALRVFFEAYIDGDGWRSGSHSIQAYTVSKRLADDLMEVGLKIGYHPRLMNTRAPRDGGVIDGRRVTGKRLSYRVSFSKGAIYYERGYGDKKTGSWTDVEYDGLVACPSVGSGIFYIRRNGKCCWTGNTELWGAESKEATRFWEELTPVPTIPDSMRIIETYAGYEGESLLLKNLYDTGMAGRQLTAGEFAERTNTSLGAFEESPNAEDAVPIWENLNASMLTYWDSGVQARRMPWQKGERGDAYYRQQEIDLAPPAFRRFHLNEWSSAESQFIHETAWDACLDTSLPPLLPGDRTPIVLGVDAASTYDCFAIVAVSRHPTRHEEVAVRAVRVFDPRETGGHVDYDEAERFIRRICGGYCASVAQHPVTMPEPGCSECESKTFVPGNNVVHVAFDPYQLTSMMQRLTREQIAWCSEFSQQGDRLRADKGLYDAIIQRRIWHNGDPRLKQHVLNAGAKVQKDADSTLRLVKVAPGRKIDAVVATSMAHARCLWLTL